MNVIGEKYERETDQSNDIPLETVSLADDLGFCMYVEQNIADIFKQVFEINKKNDQSSRNVFFGLKF